MIQNGTNIYGFIIGLMAMKLIKLFQLLQHSFFYLSIVSSMGNLISEFFERRWNWNYIVFSPQEKYLYQERCGQWRQRWVGCWRRWSTPRRWGTGWGTCRPPSINWGSRCSRTKCHLQPSDRGAELPEWGSYHIKHFSWSLVKNIRTQCNTPEERFPLNALKPKHARPEDDSSTCHNTNTNAHN